MSTVSFDAVAVADGGMKRIVSKHLPKEPGRSHAVVAPTGPLSARAGDGSWSSFAKLPIYDGDTIDGPGNVPWQATQVDRAVAMPPRPVIRLAPRDGVEPPATPA